MTKQTLLSACLSVLAAASLLGARPARACSIVRPPAALQGYPADGDTDVPTDVRPVFDSFVAWLDDFNQQAPTFQLTSTGGQMVAVTARASFVGGFELIPEAELEPLTAYTLTGQWVSVFGSPAMAISVSVSFTTGAGPLADSPPPVLASMQHYVFDTAPASTCGPLRTGTCVSLPAGVLVKATYIDEFGQERGGYLPDGELVGYLRQGPFFTNLSRVEQGTNFECVKLSARAANGTFGAPLVLCGSDAPTYGLRGSTVIGCSPDGLTHDGRLVSQSSSPDERVIPGDGGGGCSLGGNQTDSARAAWLVLLSALAARAGAGRRRPLRQSS